MIKVLAREDSRGTSGLAKPGELSTVPHGNSRERGGSPGSAGAALVSVAISNARNWLSPSKSSMIVIGGEQKRGLPGRLFSLGFHDLTI